jgi:hypothetical protein
VSQHCGRRRGGGGGRERRSAPVCGHSLGSGDRPGLLYRRLGEGCLFGFSFQGILGLGTTRDKVMEHFFFCTSGHLLSSEH